MWKKYSYALQLKTKTRPSERYLLCKAQCHLHLYCGVTTHAELRCHSCKTEKKLSDTRKTEIHLSIQRFEVYCCHLLTGFKFLLNFKQNLRLEKGIVRFGIYTNVLGTTLTSLIIFYKFSSDRAKLLTRLIQAKQLYKNYSFIFKNDWQFNVTSINLTQPNSNRLTL